MRDRVASLYVQSQAAGILDCSQIDPANKHSRLRTRLLLEEVGRRINEKYAFAKLLEAMAILGTHSRMQNSAMPDVGDLLKKRFLSFTESLLPDAEAADEQQTKANILKQAISDWEGTFGVKIDGPEVQAVAEKMQQLLKAAEETHKTGMEEANFIAKRALQRQKRHGR